MAYIQGVSIFCPAGGRMMLADTALSIYQLGRELTKMGVPHAFQWTSCSDITELRNFAITRWYEVEKTSSHLLMLDADMKWDAQMVLDMLAFDQPLTGCIYIKRQYPPEAIGAVLTGKETLDDVVDGFLEVESVGAGVLLIKREVVDKMLQRYPEISDYSGFHQVAGPLQSINVVRLIRAFDPVVFPKGHPYAPKGGRLSEDLSFCYRWRECGGKVWANVAHSVDHIGPHNYSASYMDFLAMQKQKKDAGDTVGHGCAPAPAHPLPPIVGETPKKEAA